MKYFRFYFLSFFCTVSLLLNAQSQSQLRLPSILSDHMLLQQNSEVKFWGWAKPRSTVKIITGWDNDTIEVKTTEKAKWETYLKTPPAGGPYTIKVEEKDRSLTINDILIGELWLCSGQSNMEWSARSGVIDAKEEVATCANNNIRFFFINKATADYPQDDCSGYWKVCTPESMEWFSATGYFFGKKLQQQLQMPIGLIHANWGGTAAETWTPKEKIEDESDLYKSWQRLKPSTGWDVTIAATYNAMIAPITNIKLAGVIWYQGENNVLNADKYEDLFTTMIQGWREKFQTNLPFYYVQIAPYNRYPVPYSAALVREQQTQAMDFDNTGMIVVSDCVDNINDIHPRYKKPVGERLANWALAETYKKPAGKYRHATFEKMEIENNKVRVYFKNADSGLLIKGKEIETLELAGSDGVYHPATGKIDKKSNTLLVESKLVKSPMNVRFSFSNNGVGNLFDSEGLPVVPFRTDSEVFSLTPPVKK